MKEAMTQTSRATGRNNPHDGRVRTAAPPARPVLIATKMVRRAAQSPSGNSGSSLARQSVARPQSVRSIKGMNKASERINSDMATK